MKLPNFIFSVILGILLASATKRSRKRRGFSPGFCFMWERCHDCFSSHRLDAYLSQKRSVSSRKSLASSKGDDETVKASPFA
ncbi:hypothetical protein Nepgr_031352 [Nepenthes gracilis]|uniref:Secreted protein n=1 Tax=Nepenthes gracilis TaxID=150966 RepID=A0AAD3TI46_NEPGR|nr:hypothetical protein Nepgr_031352 [Nepenthes gracilis]